MIAPCNDFVSPNKSTIVRSVSIVVHHLIRRSVVNRSLILFPALSSLIT
jgi:hypothetical protein